MKYNPNEIEAKWQKYWLDNATFKAENNSEKPKIPNRNKTKNTLSTTEK